MANMWNKTTASKILAPIFPYEDDGNSTALGNVSREHFSLVETAIFGTWISISMVFAIFGNLMVIAVVIRHRGMRTRTNMFLVNLAIADFLVGVLLAPFSLTTLIAKDWIFGDILCFINSFCNAAFLITSIQTLMYISIHKYLSITRPLTQITKCKILIMIGAAWGWAIVCASLTTFILSTSKYKEGTMQCGPKYPTYSTKSLTFHFIIQASNIFLPLFLMIGCYVRMFAEIKQHMQRLDENTALDRNMIFSQQRRVTITLLIVLSCFVLCWIPYCVYSNYAAFVRDKSTIPRYANAIAYCFGYMNSACNPIIYAWRSPSFREGYKEILCQEPSYVVSDDDPQEKLPKMLVYTLHDSSPGPLRRLSTMIHASFRGSRHGSRRNSDESIHSLRLGRNSVASPTTLSSHKLIRQLTSKTAKGSSLIRRDGSIIMIKNGKIISMRRDPSFSRMSDDVFLPSPSETTLHSMEMSHSNHSALNKVKEESFETEPLLNDDKSSQQITTGNGHVSLIETSPDKNHNLKNNSSIPESNKANSPRKRLTRMARVTSSSDDNIAVNTSDCGIQISIFDHDSSPENTNSFKFPSSHQDYINKIHDRIYTNNMKRASSETNMKLHNAAATSTFNTTSKSSNIIYNVPYLESSLRSSSDLNEQSSSSDPNMTKQAIPQYRHRYTVSKENIRCSPKK
ncbi:uncharacterized protein [Mytilus edulis]|uniref:uncharacterized protein isoform X3 n=1 Tax=Mytilus edulis TaxID=6550 RepID=UPI0039EF1837